MNGKRNVIGNLVGALLILGLIGLGVWVVMRNKSSPSNPAGTQDGNKAATLPDDSELAEMQPTPPRLDAPNAFVPKDNTLAVELSEYAGYAGLIAFNGGLSPTENSGFFKEYGFKVELTVSEEESWSALNSGKLAASATTTDVLAVYGRQFKVIVPALIGYSRGADALVVTSEISKVNDLRGKVVASAEFTEADFFIRYLAQDAGIPVNMLPDLRTKADPNSINLVFCQDAFAAGDLLLKDVQAGGKRIAGCTSWSPKTEEIVEASARRLKILVSNRNLLIVSDIMIVNRGFADASPNMVAGLVGGLLKGNKMVTSNPIQHYEVIERAFKWENGQAKDELAKVHLANLPENLAFFSGQIDTAGSFDGIFQSAVLAYGTGIISDPVNPATFVRTTTLQEINKSGVYSGERMTIVPIKLTGEAVERNPILSKNIRFLFQPLEAKLEPNDPANAQNIESIQQMLRISPGSTILLRGHVDDGQKATFAAAGQEQLRKGSLRAMQLSQQRADAVQKALVEAGVPLERIDTLGRGWEEPLGTDKDKNRRVEVQWFTVE